MSQLMSIIYVFLTIETLNKGITCIIINGPTLNKDDDYSQLSSCFGCVIIVWSHKTIIKMSVVLH